MGEIRIRAGAVATRVVLVRLGRANILTSLRAQVSGKETLRAPYSICSTVLAVPALVLSIKSPKRQVGLGDGLATLAGMLTSVLAGSVVNLAAGVEGRV